MPTRLLSLIFLLFSGWASAQTDSAVVQKLLPGYGLKVGISLSLAEGSKPLPKESYYPGGGAIFGFLAEFPVSNSFSTEVNLFLNGRGYNANYYNTTDSLRKHYQAGGSFWYLELPVLLQYNTLLPSRKLTFVAGPHFAYLISRRESIAWLDGKRYEKITAQGREGVNSFLVGVTAGVQVNLRLWRLGLRIGSDLTNATRKNRAYFGGPYRFRFAQFEIGFLLGNNKQKYTGEPI